jgi:tetratricopeptide (TPR) repeat protein
MRYKHTNSPVDQIGRELGVDCILEGSVREEGDRVRISVQLIRTRDQIHLWANNYERQLCNILQLENDVARAVAAGVELQLTPQQQARLTSAKPVHTAAYEAYLKGRYLWNKRTKEGFERGLDYLQQAIQHDPDYALPYAGLADSYNVLSYYGLMPPQEACARSVAASTKALTLDDAISEAHAALANALFWWEWDWHDAEKEFKKALDLNPNYAHARQWYAYYLVSMGRTRESIAEVRRAQEIEPLAAIVSASAGRIHTLVRQYEQAVSDCRRALELDPTCAPARADLGWAYEQMGRPEDALEEFRTARVLDESPPAVGALGYALGATGRKAEAHRLLQELIERAETSYFPPYEIALVFVGLRDKDHAFEWLEKAYQERYAWLVHLNVEPRFDVLRSDSRFQKLARSIGLP